MKRIIYKNLDNTVSIIIPSDEALKSMTIAEIAAKDVPAGKEYHIVDASEIPTNRTFRGAWTWQ